jgi:D-3-phosphoglycerate dehydrogenase
VVLTDHAAWYSEEAIADLQRQAAEEVARVLRGEKPLNQVNKDPFPA